ncbi:MAG TPA: hypothetical protein VMU41_04430 [Candidatus Binataceae bacterium]|nr:hypothetical protein [Candidatus Binataceae bacterium]
MTAISALGNAAFTYDASGRRTAVTGGLAAVTLSANVTSSGTTHNADDAQAKFNGTSLSYDAKAI